MKKEITIVPEVIENKIFLIRGKKVMLDNDLAALYSVETKQLKRAVKRNLKRFPEDFMFELTKKEFKVLRCHFGTSKTRGGRQYAPYAFTEQGLAMLSGILSSNRAIAVNIQIMRTFTKLRAIILTHKELQNKIAEMEKKYDHQFQAVFEAIKQLLRPPEPPPNPNRGKWGFVPNKTS
ncbi:MAG: ORF6N domain-containing protein [Candidatus Margulisbacteria bacterium]|nr:ORF6N domain-containing protein [Candidatus Margulisiibacteriota bacterium]